MAQLKMWRTGWQLPGTGGEWGLRVGCQRPAVGISLLAEMLSLVSVKVEMLSCSVTWRELEKDTQGVSVLHLIITQESTVSQKKEFHLKKERQHWACQKPYRAAPWVDGSGSRVCMPLGRGGEGRWWGDTDLTEGWASAGRAPGLTQGPSCATLTPSPGSHRS